MTEENEQNNDGRPEGYLGVLPEMNMPVKTNQGQGVEYTSRARDDDESRKAEIMVDPLYQKSYPNFQKHDQLVNELMAINERLFADPDRENVPEQDRGLYDVLHKEGFTKAGIEYMGEEGRQKIADEESKKVMLKAEGELRGIWPTSEEYNSNISRVHFVLDKIIADPGERRAIIENYGNDTQMVEALAILVQKLEAIFPNFKDASKYVRIRKGKK
jgi:hypothetical protein